MTDVSYVAPGETVRRFMSSDAFVRGLRGPVGSGKSVGCCAEIMRRALMQQPGPDGLRKTRWAVIRNTAPELKTTTIKTWLDWWKEEEWGKFNWAPPFTHHIRKGDLDMEVIFLALDRPEDAKKLLSLELTGGWINEARVVPKAIVDALTSRVRRYPAERVGGPTWCGVIMDTNPPAEDHWWPVMAGDMPPPDWMTEDEARHLVRPSNWAFFSQPGAMIEKKNAAGHTSYAINPGRENQAGVKDIYYQQQLPGKTAEWIRVYLCGRYGSIVDGKPVYPDFDRQLHVAAEPLPVFTASPVYVGIDFGLTPAAVFGQNIRGRWHILRELVAFDMGVVRFAGLLKRDMLALGAAEFVIFGDPAGDQRVQTDEDTPYRILRAQGIMVREASSNDPALRIEAVQAPLTRFTDRKPGLLIDPRCTMLIKGFDGAYHYKRLQVTGERYTESPDKNRFSHVHDALQYMMLGGGEGRKLQSAHGEGAPAVVVKERNWDVFARHQKTRRSSLPRW